jgi:3''-deamino-3''-oxonicotianamine reductase
LIWNSGNCGGDLRRRLLATVTFLISLFPSQVSLRWIYEQGVTWIVKSYNKERLKKNLDIFGWELTEEDRQKISKIPQRKFLTATALFSPEGEFTSVDLSETDIVEE